MEFLDLTMTAVFLEHQSNIYFFFLQSLDPKLQIKQISEWGKKNPAVI